MSSMKISRIFSFSAAHHLTDYHGACERPHGHTYRLEVIIEGPIKQDGLVIDFVELKRVVEEKVLRKLDHTDLNDLLPNPSAELIGVWIWEQLAGAFSGVKLAGIRLWEGENTAVVYEG